jgi:hypothetical protein
MALFTGAWKLGLYRALAILIWLTGNGICSRIWFTLPKASLLFLRAIAHFCCSSPGFTRLANRLSYFSLIPNYSCHFIRKLDFSLWFQIWWPREVSHCCYNLLSFHLSCFLLIEFVYPSIWFSFLVHFYIDFAFIAGKVFADAEAKLLLFFLLYFCFAHFVFHGTVWFCPIVVFVFPRSPH